MLETSRRPRWSACRRNRMGRMVGDRAQWVGALLPRHEEWHFRSPAPMSRLGGSYMHTCNPSATGGWGATYTEGSLGLAPNTSPAPGSTIKWKVPEQSTRYAPLTPLCIRIGTCTYTRHIPPPHTHTHRNREEGLGRWSVKLIL